MDLSDLGLIINYGVSPVIVVFLILTGILVPKVYVSKLEKENELQRQQLEIQKQITKDAIDSAANSNQLIGALKTEAQLRRKEYGEDNPRSGS